MSFWRGNPLRTRPDGKASASHAPDGIAGLKLSRRNFPQEKCYVCSDDQG